MESAKQPLVRVEISGLSRGLSEFAVGDEFDFQGHAQVVAIADELVDITSFGSREPRYVTGIRTVTLALGKIDPL